MYGWGNGWYGYMYEAAYWEMQQLSNLPWGTTYNNERDFLNNNQSATRFYADPEDRPGSTYLNYSTFTGDMAYDLEKYGGALVASVDTVGLPNWNGVTVSHYVSINGWDPTDGNLNYADTAWNDSRGSTFANERMSAYSFWQSAIQGTHSGNLVIY